MDVINQRATALVGVDTGGTFTDFVVIDANGIHVHKVLSTPGSPDTAIIQGLRELDVFDRLTALVHGSTVATNAVLERKGVRTGLITTAGFRDVLEIGRQTRPKLYDLRVTREEPLVPRDLRVEVGERLDERGGVITPLDSDSVAAAVQAMADAKVESVAICLLFSFANPAHEQAVAEAARAAGLHVSASSEVLPEFREYERTSTVVLNAYVAPLMDRYLARLEATLPNSTPLRIMQSNGGSISSATARREAARTLLSGPAAGVVGAAFVAAASGINRVISFDMGGTSTDVALIDGAVTETTDGRIGGHPTRLPTIDIHTVGAGGGSIAWFDLGGALRAGPQSAGADPGPAAYGNGGTEPTVTDANVALGRLIPDRFLGGTMTLDVSAARAAIEPIAQRLDASVEEAALGIIRVANANMEAAIRVISVERGHDPRLFALVAFGGAGPLHACELADALRIPRVLAPATPGVLSALGMLAADVLKDYVRTVMVEDDTAEEAIEPVFRELSETGRADLLTEGVAADQIQIERLLDIRYVGQSYELVVPYEGDLHAAVEAFHQAHERRFGYSDPGERVQIVNVRVKARGVSTPPELSRGEQSEATPATPADYRAVVFGVDGVPQAINTPIYDRATLSAGQTIVGPAIVTQYDTTLVIPPGWHAAADVAGNLIMERAE